MFWKDKAELASFINTLVVPSSRAISAEHVVRCIDCAICSVMAYLCWFYFSLACFFSYLYSSLTHFKYPLMSVLLHATCPRNFHLIPPHFTRLSQSLQERLSSLGIRVVKLPTQQELQWRYSEQDVVANVMTRCICSWQSQFKYSWVLTLFCIRRCSFWIAFPRKSRRNRCCRPANP